MKVIVTTDMRCRGSAAEHLVQLAALPAVMGQNENATVHNGFPTVD